MTPAFDYMYAEIGVNSRKNKARYKSGKQRIPASRFSSPFEPASSCFLHFQRDVRISGTVSKACLSLAMS